MTFTLRSKLVLLLAVSSGVMSNGQFLRPTVVRSFASSWMSSSSWVPGRDGQMHVQVQEVQTETFRDHGVAVKHTESHTACRDGNCQQTLSVEKPGSFTVISNGDLVSAAGSGHFNILPRLHAMLRGSSFPVYVEERQAPSSRVVFLAPRAAAGDATETALSPPTVDELPDLVFSLTAPLVALAVAVASLVVLLVASVLKLQHSGARELPALGEPLAPTQEAEAHVLHSRCDAATRATHLEEKAVPELVAVRAYLERSYARAAAASQAAATRVYLGRIYGRAVA